MSDLYTRLLAAIEHGEQTARSTESTWPGPWTYDRAHLRLKDRDGHVIDSAARALGTYMVEHQPAAEVRRYAEDRALLAEHHPDTDLESQRQFWECVACSHEIECNSDRYRDHNITVLWPCREVLRLARRLGVQP